jgi:hypothetical protein
MQAEGWRKARDDTKRPRADVDVLERELFRLFEGQPNWSMVKLVEETRQPAAHLKTVLEKVGHSDDDVAIRSASLQGVLRAPRHAVNLSPHRSLCMSSAGPTGRHIS